MLWVLAAGLILLTALIFFLRTRGTPPAKSYRDAPLTGDLLPHLKSVAGEAPGGGRTGLTLHRGMLRRFEKQADFLSALPDDELLPGAMWLCENGRYLQEKMVSAMAASRGVRGLPAAKDGDSRILCFAREYVGHRMAEIQLESLGKALAAWQEISTFSQREIQLLPLALRVALLDIISEMTALLAAEQHSRQKAGQLVRFLRHQKEKQSLRIFAAHRHEPAFLERLLSEMHRQEEGQQILWLERYFNQNDLSADKLTRSEHQHQTDNSLWIGNAITSLRAIDHAPWEQLLETWSPLHTMLLEDAVYPAMDMESRAYYRECVHRLSRLTHKPELTVCGAAMTLSRADHPESLMHHVGYYLLDDGRDSLLSYLHTDRPFPLPMNRAKRTLFLRILCWESFALLLFVGFLLGVPWPLLPLFALPLFFTLAELGLSAYRRYAPPKMTPRMQLDSLKPEQRTLVVCPTMLLSREQALAMAGHLSMLHSANPDPNLHFMLLGDYRDSLTATMNDDDEIVAAASAAIRALREDTGHEFLYFQRERVFHAPDHLHMSRERKRGSLETLLKLICGQETEDSFTYASLAPEKLQGRYRYVITLDSDTFLPPGAALRMVGAMCHPLQQRRRVDGRMRGVSILQPRMEVSPGSVGSWLSLLFGAPTSCSPYNSLVSDFYADAMRSGSFQGKGIIDPAAFLEATEGKILPGLVLSHDLLEGQLAGCAFSSDILLFETNPSALKGFLNRLHRWTRGDWQLLAYLVPFIPHVDSGPRRALNTLDRHKLWGNVFRSLAIPARVISLFVLAALGKHWLFLLLFLAPEIPALIPFGKTALLSALVRLAALSVFAAVQLDAIGRALYRLLVSRQNLLKWTTAAQLSNPTDKPSMQVYYMSIGGALLMGFFSLVGGFDLTPGLITAAFFALFPFTLPLLEQSTERSLYPTGYMREVLSSIAQETLLYYETSITPEDNGLPPDNVQIDPNKGITHRTSPTNIGLYLVALVSAEKLRLLPLEQLAMRVEAAVDSLETMEKWHGHLYNWHSTQTLAPLPPAYVSSVDSGNLAVCLLTAAQGLRVLLPDLPPRYHVLPERLDNLVHQMDFRPLFDPDAELFRVGVYPDRPEDVQPHYDLLASESRLLSYVAIMLGQVPVRHWYRLGRSRAHTRQGQTLLSYSGTMFEYMMPLLFHRPVRGTLLDHSLRTAMKVQSRHKLGGAWGVSESGYLAYDPQLFYQYQAFGIPSLALKSEVDSQVLAPYASVMTLPLHLKPAFMNLLRLRSMGLEGPLGLFEAADFHPRRVGEKKPFQIIRSHMAHHQGMILITICNVLCRWYIADLFGHLPRAQAYRLLLEEKYVDVQTIIRHPLKRRFEKPVTAGYQAWRAAQPLSLPVDAHLLSGAGTTLLIDAQGGGYMSRNGIMLTRFHESCHLPSGMRLYLKDSQSGSVWQATDPKLSKAVEFETAQAIFTHERFHVETQLRMFVNPLDGAVIHCLTLENQSPADRMLELCSYLEPALASQQEDSAHPAFQNLLMQSKKLGKSGAAIRCRPRQERTPPLHLWQTLTADVPFHLFRIQTDRTAFIGRGRTLHAPRGMELPISGLADSLGDMIEPCLSLRAQFVLPANGKVQLAFVTLSPSQRETETGFLERYDRPENALRTFEAAATQGVVTARYLDLEPEEYCQVSRLTGCLAYTGQPMQFRCSAMNTLPMKDLAALHIHGSLPILLLECTSADGLPLVKTLLKAHALLRMGGLWFDLVLLADSPKNDDLQKRLTEAVKNSHSSETLRQDGGVHIFTMDNLSPGQPELLRAAARLRLSTAAGSLKQQLDQLHSLVASPAAYQHKPSVPWKPALPPMEDLTLDNEFGGFSMPDGNYVILLPPGRQTPAPWCNPLVNQDFGTLAGESGLLLTYAMNSQQGRLNHWPNDSVTPRGDELFFLQDGQHKLLWSLTRFPLAGDLPCRVTYAPGEAIYECSGYGIYSRLTCFTDAEFTLGLRIIQLKNEDKTDRVLTLWHTCAFHPGDKPGSEQLCAMERTERGVTMSCPDLDGACCLVGLDPAPTLCANISNGAFYGLSGPVPHALASSEALSGDGGNVAVIGFTVQLKPGESKQITTLLGYGISRARLERAVTSAAEDGATHRLHQMRLFWANQLSGLLFDLPDPTLSLMMNRWLPYQTMASRLMMRGGLYQCGGALGFRDQLQDMLALLHTRPARVRDTLLLFASHQYEEGDVQHWWTESTTGARTRISDDMLFLPYLTGIYVQVTGDISILTEAVPYLHSKPLSPDENDRLETANPSPITESLLQHCLRAIDQVRFGPHGLPLMQGGDWNDGMNRVGGEKGESIWLGMFLCEVLRRFSPLCDAATVNRFATLRIRLLQALDQTAWDGGWYLRGWYSTGDPLGGSSSTECRIDLLPQCWAVFSGLSRERSAIAMESAWQHLWEPDIGILKLLTPPFNGAEDPGYIAAYVPGVRENGGQYTHAATWAMAAWYQLGQYDRAWELALWLLPPNHCHTKQTAIRYRVEPYVMAADIYSGPRHRGRGGWTWYTGSPAWYQYLMLTELLGFRKTGNTLRFRPVLPTGWDWVRITYRYGSATYHLTGRRDCPFPTADGERLKEGAIILQDDGRIHEGIFPIRA